MGSRIIPRPCVNSGDFSLCSFGVIVSPLGCSCSFLSYPVLCPATLTMLTSSHSQFCLGTKFHLGSPPCAGAWTVSQTKYHSHRAYFIYFQWKRITISNHLISNIQKLLIWGQHCGAVG